MWLGLLGGRPIVRDLWDSVILTARMCPVLTIRSNWAGIVPGNLRFAENTAIIREYHQQLLH